MRTPPHATLITLLVLVATAMAADLAPTPGGDPGLSPEFRERHDPYDQFFSSSQNSGFGDTNRILDDQDALMLEEEARDWEHDVDQRLDDIEHEESVDRWNRATGRGMP